MKYLSFGLLIGFTVCASRTDAQTFSALLQFSGTGNGAKPHGTLTLSGTVLNDMTTEGGTSLRGKTRRPHGLVTTEQSRQAFSCN